VAAVTKTSNIIQSTPILGRGHAIVGCALHHHRAPTPTAITGVSDDATLPGPIRDGEKVTMPNFGTSTIQPPLDSHKFHEFKVK
jgi:hypothetical protein